MVELFLRLYYYYLLLISKKKSSKRELLSFQIVRGVICRLFYKFAGGVICCTVMFSASLRNLAVA